MFGSKKVQQTPAGAAYSAALDARLLAARPLAIVDDPSYHTLSLVEREAMIEEYILLVLDELEQQEGFDINDPSHDVMTVINKIKNAHNKAFQRMFRGGPVYQRDYNNRYIADRLDAANLKRVTKRKTPPTRPYWSFGSPPPNPEVEKNERYFQLIQRGNTFRSKVDVLPEKSCCVLQGGKYGKDKKTKNIRCKNKSHRIQLGGCTDRQKGIAAQIRTYTQGELREELNSIVHSGDSISAKSHHPSNPYIDLSNSFDSKAEDVINRAISFIKENEHISYKNKKKILNGISQFNTMTNATSTMNKSTTSLSSQVTPKKTFKDAITANRMTTIAPVRRSRTSRRGRSRTSRRGRSRTSRRGRS